MIKYNLFKTKKTMIDAFYRKNRKDLILIARYYGAKNPEDIVQDLFLILSNKKLKGTLKDENLELRYAFYVIRNLSIKELKSERKYVRKEIESEANDFDFEKELDDIIKGTQEDKIFLRYALEDFTMRALAKELGIKTHRVFKAIKNTKNKLK